MKDLPTISVTQTQLDTIVEAFKTVPEYKKWLKQAVRKESMRRKSNELRVRDDQLRHVEEREFSNKLPESDEDLDAPL